MKSRSLPQIGIVVDARSCAQAAGSPAGSRSSSHIGRYGSSVRAIAIALGRFQQLCPSSATSIVSPTRVVNRRERPRALFEFGARDALAEAVRRGAVERPDLHARIALVRQLARQPGGVAEEALAVLEVRRS